MKPTKIAAIFLVIVAILMTSLGGILDMFHSDFHITKQHAWNDGLFILVLAIALLML